MPCSQKTEERTRRRRRRRRRRSSVEGSGLSKAGAWTHSIILQKQDDAMYICIEVE